MDYDPCWAGRLWLRCAASALISCLLPCSFTFAAELGLEATTPSLPLSTLETSDRRVLRVIRFNHNAAPDTRREVAVQTRMIRDFADSADLEIKWVDVFRSTEALQKLLGGEGDLSIGAVPIDHHMDARLSASMPIALQRFRVIGRDDESSENPLELAGRRLAVKMSSPMWPYLERLRAVVADLRLEVLPNELHRDEILQMLSDGLYDAALIAVEVGDEPTADFPRLKTLFDLTGLEPVSWFARRDNALLVDAINEFIKRFHTAYHNPNPSVRTFADIKQQGVLRIITRLDGRNYFLNHGQPAGFELGLARRFADRHGLRLEVLVGRSDDEILRWLSSGAGDIVTTRIGTHKVHGEPAFSMSREYRHDALVLVTSSENPIRSSADLRGKTVAGYAGSLELAALEDILSGAGTVISVDRQVSMTLLFERVAAGEVDAAVIEAHRLEAGSVTHDKLVVGMSIPNPYRYRWTLRAEDGPLVEAVEEFIQTEYRDETYNVLERRYVQARQVAKYRFDDISPFDDLLQTYADRYGFDWRLIAAQMYQESHFDPKAVSVAGAVGLMQLMPATAESLGFSDPADPEVGIHAGIKYLDRLRDRFDRHIPMNERTWLALAAYNIGYDRVRRARILAREAGLNPDKWFDNVEMAMLRMTRVGSIKAAGCRCGQAIVYVRAIRSLYSAYRNLVLAAKTPRSSSWPHAPRVSRLTTGNAG